VPELAGEPVSDPVYVPVGRPAVTPATPLLEDPSADTAEVAEEDVTELAGEELELSWLLALLVETCAVLLEDDAALPETTELEDAC